MNKETVGERVKWAREVLACTTQKQLAKKAKITNTTLCSIETGNRQPQPHTLRKIADATGTTLHWLLHGSQDPEGADASIDSTYARVELMGHIDLGICKVREVDSLGGKSLEVTELNKDGSDGAVRLVEKPAIYMRTVVTKEAAMKDASGRFRYDPPGPAPLSPCTELVRPVPWTAIERDAERHTFLGRGT